MGKIRKVMLETVPLTDSSKFVFGDTDDKMYFEDPEKYHTPDYPLDKLVESIQQNGFIPNFPDTPYHQERFHSFPQTLVLDFQDGKYRAPMGTHRLHAARKVGLTEIPCYVEKEVEVSHSQLREFEEAVAFMKSQQLDYQSWVFPSAVLEGRDPSYLILSQFNAAAPLINIFAGRTVLDIACNAGFFAVQAGLMGATEIVGFDVDSQAIKAANMIAKAYQLQNYKFFTCEFWDYPFDKEYDIVFCNQAIYHFTSRHRSQCKGTVSDMLDRIARATKRVLLMFTFVDVTEAPCKDGGWYPSTFELTDNLKRRKFRSVTVEHRVQGAKKHVTAVKEFQNLVAHEIKEGTE